MFVDIELNESAIESYAGRKILLGVRPSDINRCRSSDGANAFRASVEVVEHMGDVVTTYLKAGAHELIAQFPSEFEPEVGADVPIAMDAARIHLFDAETGKTVL